mmetsp:Transcript_8331/g.25731  ORF Transcript_8331/g.25731 Transcript_8331/m.25731 type:complete len:162 (-) Transcript_8331:239-724(-)|eukprot:CAMPEP_0198645252 /NCGR_PEP_ID=MMETSP1467-20131203/1153_1 /TAXON_ID=1462469 /ORGANISM="unid. sp., Strain CCMP2135" /LENGTH=161 /DNA_ID=CAMNT_0044380741 /DNA_START=35 /DNA_END=520 /DNA_ORIENTATION=+
MSVSTFDQALAKGAALLALKVAGVHFLTIRERLLSGDMTTGRAALWKEDTEIPKPVAIAFKTAFLAFGPSLATVSRFNGCQGNANENEPYFMLMALGLARSGLPIPTWGATAIYTYVAARFAHTFIFIFLRDALPQPGRAAPWAISFFTMIALGVATVTAA